MISRIRATASSATKRAHAPALKEKHLPHLSNRLHNFPLPVLKWGGTRRAVRSEPGDHPNLAPRSCDVFPCRIPLDDVSHHPPFPALETSSQAAGTIDSAVGEIKEFGEKLLDDLRSAVKMEYQLLEDAGARGSNLEKPATTGPCNLRARRSRCRPPGECKDSTRLDAPACPAQETKISEKIGRSPSVNYPTGVSGPLAEAGLGVGDEDKASAARPWNLPGETRKTSHRSSDDSSWKDSTAATSMPAAAPTTTTTANLFKSSRLRSRAAAAGESGLRRKFPLALSKEEVEEDWLSITGSKPPRRPTKRPRHIQQQLDLCFPGSLLSEVTPDTYKVFDSHKR